MNDVVTVSAAEHAALTQRVTGVEAAVESIRKDIHGLVSKFDERSRMPWATILAGAGLMFTVMTTFTTALVAAASWGLQSQNAYMVKSLDEFKAIYGENRVIARQDNEARNADIRAEFARVDGVLSRSVPREEHQQIWLAQSNTDRDQQRQIDEVKQQLSSLDGARDFFKDVQDRLDRLERSRNPLD
jgi:hypothetical protein